MANTSDGSDNKQIIIGGGGASGFGRGSNIYLYGNEHSTQAGDMLLEAGTGGDIDFITGSGSTRFRLNSSGDLIYLNTSTVIRADTTDGSDNARLLLAGGGDSTDSRGGYIIINGNEHAGLGGIQIHSGTASAGVGINIQVNSSTGELNLGTNGATRVAINSSGRLTHKAHSGYAGTGRVQETAAVNTTDNTTTNLYTLTLADNTTYMFEVNISARYNSTTAKGVGGKLKFLVYRNNGGAATIAADNGGRIKEIESYGTPGYDFDVDVTGNDIRIRVTGATSETVSWTATIERVGVSTAS